MGILRADLLTHSQLSNEGGSIVLDGSGDYLSFAAHSAFAPATADVTFELWFYLNADSDFTDSSADSNYYFFDMGSNGYRIQMYSGLIRFGVDGSSWTPPASGVSKTKWHHVAGVREGNSLDLYLDGKHVGQKSTTASVTSTSLTIGQYGGNLSYNGVPHGYISNFRYVRGVVYRGEFTPPKFELKNIPGTIVLGCQSTSSATDFAVTPSTISVGGNTAASTFHPGLKKDITDTGVVFDGFGSFATSTYMVPPSGKTTERNRGRALIMGGASSPGSNNQTAIQYFNIQSMGTAQFFGSLTVARRALQGLSSSTRGLALGGFISPPATVSDTIDFVTFASTANAIDFGNLTSTAYAAATASNDTRGLFAGGYRPNNSAVVDSIDYVTIATAGNAADFGNLVAAQRANAGGSNTTRAVFAAGAYPAVTNVIQYVTIATTGNATDFGDLTVARDYPAGGGSSPTRTCFAGGRTPSNTNTIDFITTATTGNATDFGDSQSGGIKHGLVSNRTRGVICSDATITNTLEYITFATTGDALDFGDQSSTSNSPTVYSPGACSDSHGGLS